jgi:hypothetical protein
LTKAPTKTASDDGATPFQLLEMYGEGDEEAGRLFEEYSAAFHGRAQLQWSRGLRALLGLTEDEPSDADIMAAADDSPQLLASLNRYTWYKLIHLPRDVRGELLCVARRGDVGQLEAFISGAIGEKVALRNSDTVDEIREFSNFDEQMSSKFESFVTEQGSEPVTKFAGWADSLPSSSAACDVASAGKFDAPVSQPPAGGLGLGTVVSNFDDIERSNHDGSVDSGTKQVERGDGFSDDVAYWAQAAARRFEAAGWKRVRRPGNTQSTVLRVDGSPSEEAER